MKLRFNMILSILLILNFYSTAFSFLNSIGCSIIYTNSRIIQAHQQSSGDYFSNVVFINQYESSEVELENVTVIKILVLGPENNLISNALVISISKPSNQTKLEDKTDSNGMVVFENISPGNYTFYVSKSGYNSEAFIIEVNKYQKINTIIELKTPKKDVIITRKIPLDLNDISAVFAVLSFSLLVTSLVPSNYYEKKSIDINNKKIRNIMTLFIILFIMTLFIRVFDQVIFR